MPQNPLPSALGMRRLRRLCGGISGIGGGCGMSGKGYRRGEGRNRGIERVA